jgi:hypothetical protein
VASLTSSGGALGNMQQRPYFPPNVAGWEGGLSWFNSNTVQARFNTISQAQALRYGTTYKSPATPADDVSGESAQATFDRAYGSVGAPWISASSRTSIVAFLGDAVKFPVSTAAQRRQRFYMAQALILGGPDGQVM